MTPDEYPLHDSIRGWFGRELYFQMQRNPDIILITADLGYGLFDRHRDDMPSQFYNVGASECLAVGAAVGLALEHKIPFVYSITSFLMFRSFEWIRNYVNHEKIPVRLVGSGVEKDYAHDGITHQPSLKELNLCFAAFPNIETYMPDDKENVPTMVDKMVMRKRTLVHLFTTMIFYGLGFCIYEWNTFGKKHVCRVIPNRPWWRPKELMWKKEWHDTNRQ